MKKHVMGTSMPCFSFESSLYFVLSLVCFYFILFSLCYF